MIHATELLSRFAADLRYEDLPQEVVETTKKYIIDYYSACFAGMKINAEFNAAVEKLLMETGGAPECDYLLGKVKLPALSAAYMDAVYAHGADMDDGNRKAMGHVGAHVISAVLTLAQTTGASGRDTLTAINVGYEVFNRIAAAAQPGLVHRGFHSTGTAGAIACAAACAKLLGLDRNGIYHSMSLAAIQASGLIIIAESGQACKPLNPANAARTGIFSAKLASQGIESSVFPLESTKGWLHAMCDAPDYEMITDGLGKTFTICESYMKPYPSCRHTHCGIEAALDIHSKLSPEDRIYSVKVYIYENAIKIAGQIKEPKSTDDCKFSIRYSLAVALTKGCFGIPELNTANLTERVRDIIAKTELIADETMEQRDAGIRGAKVVVETTNGRRFEKTVPIPKGDAANPLTPEEQRRKLKDCADGILEGSAQDELFQKILAFEKIERIETINLCSTKYKGGTEN